MRPVPDRPPDRVRLLRRGRRRLDDALRRAEAARDAGEALSIGLLGNAADVLPALLARGAPINVVTDQTSAHDPLTYLPRGVAFEDMAALRAEDPAGFTSPGARVDGRARGGDGRFQDAGAEVFDYGNSIRGEAELAGYSRAFAFPGFVPAYIRPLFCEGKGRSGGRRCPATRRTSRSPTGPSWTCSPATRRWPGGSGWPGRRCTSRGCPRGSAGSATASGTWPACASTSCGARARSRADRDRPRSPRLRVGRLPLPETEAMADGSDAIADWPILNALVNTASGASWVSVHHGGGVGIGRSIHAGQVCVADGTPLAAQKLERVLSNDPGMGVIRHVDAGYEEAGRGGGRTRGAGADERGSGRAVTQDAAVSFAALWESLLPIGRDGHSGGYRRFSWTPADAECRRWFTEAAEERELRADTDRNGNLWAWWDPPGIADSRGRPGAVVTGSHLDSVPDGGAFDGPLGVVTAFAAIDLMREHGRSRAPAGGGRVLREEGARFGVACLGSRLLAGAIEPGRAGGLRDRDGITFAEAMTAAGRIPRRSARIRGWSRHRRLRGAAHRAGPGPGRPSTPRSGWRSGSGRTAGGG
jgi:hypothetical protein